MLWTEWCYTRWSPNAQCDGIWRWRLWEMIRFRWVHEGETLMMGLASLWEETLEPENMLSPSHWHVRTQQKKSNHLQVTFHQISITLETDLELPAFRTVRNKFLFCKLPNLWYFVMSGWAVYYICIREERKMWLEMQRRRKRRDAWWSSKVIEFSAQAFKKALINSWEESLWKLSLMTWSHQQVYVTWSYEGYN